MKTNRHFLFTGLCYALLCACTGLPPQEASITAFIHAQKNSALTLEDEGRYAQSLDVWRSLIPLHGSDPEVNTAISRLETTIEQRAALAMRKGESAYTRGRNDDGDTWMQRVLALQPGHQIALQALGKSQSARARAEARGKSETEHQLMVEHKGPAPDDLHRQLAALYKQRHYQQMIELGAKKQIKYDRDEATLIRHAHVALADEALNEGDLEASLVQLQEALSVKPLSNDPLLDRSAELRASLSKNWYQEGARLMKVDLPSAITALKKSLSYNPYNNAAKQKLNQAETLQRNLQRIQGKTSG
ncbi:MAG: hypothetical protein V7709_10575 [Halioglobus sp.]